MFYLQDLSQILNLSAVDVDADADVVAVVDDDDDDVVVSASVAAVVVIVGDDDAPVLALKGLRLKGMAPVSAEDSFTLDR